MRFNDSTLTLIPNLRLLALLAAKRPRLVQQLADMTGRKQANVSHTLKRLAEAGIVAMIPSPGRERRPELVATRVQLEIDLTKAAEPESRCGRGRREVSSSPTLISATLISATT